MRNHWYHQLVREDGQGPPSSGPDGRPPFGAGGSRRPMSCPLPVCTSKQKHCPLVTEHGDSALLWFGQLAEEYLLEHWGQDLS
ncbi:unnamed protein product [Natator depressus]